MESAASAPRERFGPPFAPSDSTPWRPGGTRGDPVATPGPGPRAGGERALYRLPLPAGRAARPTMSSPNAQRERALDLIRKGERFVLTGHVRPDGDCIGAAGGPRARARGARQAGRRASRTPIRSAAQFDYLARAADYRPLRGDAAARTTWPCCSTSASSRAPGRWPSRSRARARRSSSSTTTLPRRALVGRGLRRSDGLGHRAPRVRASPASSACAARPAGRGAACSPRSSPTRAGSSTATPTRRRWPLAAELVRARRRPERDLRRALPAPRPRATRAASGALLVAPRVPRRRPARGVDLPPAGTGERPSCVDSDEVLDILRSVRRGRGRALLRELEDGDVQALGAQQGRLTTSTRSRARFGGGGHGKASGATHRGAARRACARRLVDGGPRAARRRARGRGGRAPDEGRDHLRPALQPRGARGGLRAHPRARGSTTIYCLGDVVGYGPEPEFCVDLVRGHASLCLMGNHDEALFRDASDFNPHARGAIEYTRARHAAELVQLEREARRAGSG